MKILGERILKRLDVLEKPQTWLAKQIGMRQQSVNAIIAGKVKRPKLLREIASALETSQEYLLGETDDPTPRDKLPKDLRDAIDKIPGGPLTENEARYLLESVNLIVQSRTGRSVGKTGT